MNGCILMQILKEDVRKAILQAALAEFRQYGYKEASMRRIAREAGMTTGNIYRYFTSKDELFDAVVGPVYEQYHNYSTEYLQTVDDHLTSGEINKNEYFDRVQVTLVGLVKDSSPELMLLICRSEGSKYDGVKPELLSFTETLLLKSFAAVKSGGLPLTPYEQTEVGMMASTLIEGLSLIISSYEDSDTISLLVDRLVNVYCKGLHGMLEEVSGVKGGNHLA